MNMMVYYDTNYDGNINLEDDIDPEHMSELNAYCDFNNDGTLDACEIHQCVVMVENEWRMEYCPELGDLYCDCPFYVAECEGAWNCDDIYYITDDVLYYYDTTGEGVINM
jgi:hypothetical protein